MKKIILVLLILLISGCSTDTIVDDSSLEEFITISDEYPSFDDLDDVEVNYIYVEKYFKFDDLLKDENADFYQGEVVSIENFNFAVDKVFLKVSLSNRECDEIINISIEKGALWFTKGENYIVHLTYNEEYDYYSLSDVTKSIFKIDGDKVTYHDYFIDELSKDVDNNLDSFIKKVFK